MTAAFTYRKRRSDLAPQEARQGEMVLLEENAEYLLEFQSASSRTIAQLSLMGAELLTDRLWTIRFRNFVGSIELAGVSLEVLSQKIDASGVTSLLEQVSRLASQLVFGWRSPVRFTGSRSNIAKAPVLYHQLQLLRTNMLEEQPGNRLQDWLDWIERHPTRKLHQDRPLISIDRVRHMDNRTFRSIFSHLDRLAVVPSESTKGRLPLAAALTFGQPPQAHFPTKVTAPKGNLSFDTQENRFVKHAISECLTIVRRFLDHPKLHQQVKNDCREMLAALEQIFRLNFIRDAEPLTSFSGPSQALMKLEGYREVFLFWNKLQAHVSLPVNPEETQFLLEGKDISRLYEYWVFLKVLEATITATGANLNEGTTLVEHHELGTSIVVGLQTSVGTTVVRFNATFARSASTSYSTPLRPDVVVEHNGNRYAFDAKYRLGNFTENLDGDFSGDYNREDLYKMHTYRDAIHHLKAAFVVYPGTDFMFFDRSAGRQTNSNNLPRNLDGVGAIPLRPAPDASFPELQSVLRIVVS